MKCELLEKAQLDKRIAAILIDYLLLCILQSLIMVVFVFSQADKYSFELLVRGVVFCTITSFVVFLFKDQPDGVSLGKKLFKLGVRNQEDFNTIPKKTTLILRNLTILVWPIECYFLWKHGKRLGDILTKTDVYIINN